MIIPMKCLTSRIFSCVLSKEKTTIETKIKEVIFNQRIIFTLKKPASGESSVFNKKNYFLIKRIIKRREIKWLFSWLFHYEHTLYAAIKLHRQINSKFNIRKHNMELKEILLMVKYWFQIFVNFVKEDISVFIVYLKFKNFRS